MRAARDHLELALPLSRSRFLADVSRSPRGQCFWFLLLVSGNSKSRIFVHHLQDRASRFLLNRSVAADESCGHVLLYCIVSHGFFFWHFAHEFRTHPVDINGDGRIELSTTAFNIFDLPTHVDFGLHGHLKKHHLM